MFSLYLGEKGTEEHIVTKSEVRQGCFALNEKVEFGSVLGLMDKECLLMYEYRTRKKRPASDRNGTRYASYDNMKTGDKVQVQYVKYMLSKKEKRVGQFNELEQEKYRHPPKGVFTFFRLSVLNEEFINLLRSGKKIEVIECRYINEETDEKMKYFLFGFEGYLPVEGDSYEVKGTVDRIVMCNWE